MMDVNVVIWSFELTDLDSLYLVVVWMDLTRSDNVTTDSCQKFGRETICT
jgi:hypothetical protein